MQTLFSATGLVLKDLVSIVEELDLEEDEDATPAARQTLNQPSYTKGYLMVLTSPGPGLFVMAEL
jgi:hypothetical protein